jgi:hypothetical protein
MKAASLKPQFTINLIAAQAINTLTTAKNSSISEAFTDFHHFK